MKCFPMVIDILQKSFSILGVLKEPDREWKEGSREEKKRNTDVAHC